MEFIRFVLIFFSCFAITFGFMTVLEGNLQDGLALNNPSDELKGFIIMAGV